MRATLEQLKAMSNEDLKEHWVEGRFPYDKAAGCDHCIMQHFKWGCHVGHSQFFMEQCEALSRPFYELPHDPNLSCGEKRGRWLRQNLEAFFALRLFHDSLYPQTEAAEEKTIAELAPSLVAQG